ncbi:MCM-domain-containing protein, partial [Fragilariopsis cylindrus CCMP1102]
DYQEIKIQEAASKIGVGSMPRSLLIKLQHDLVDTCQPGDEVVVVGILLAQWQQSAQPGIECNVGMALKAHSARVTQENGASAFVEGAVGELDKYKKEFDSFWDDSRRREYPIASRDFICKAVCPKLYGLQVIKLSLLLTLIGGVSSSSYEGNEQANEEDENVDTNACDPGTGKSQVLRFASALCPRSVLTTGVGTTSAGLTCAAVREGDDKEFALEAGALVLADKGVCLIDEFGCIRKEDRTSIHEAMEQQTLSVAKAGIVCKLNCRATIVAVMNPRNCIYDNQVSLAQNTGLGTPLLSRFDLIFKLVDSSDAERDSNVTTYLLNRAIQGTGYDGTSTMTGEEIPWSMEKLRAYIAIVKDRFRPIISDEAATLLETHYEKVRSAQSFTIPITVRFLESLIRLSQAHARLMYRNTVTLEDAIAVLRIMECS